MSETLGCALGVLYTRLARSLTFELSTERIEGLGARAPEVSLDGPGRAGCRRSFGRGIHLRGPAKPLDPF